MIATMYSTLSGKLAGKHPTLGVLVREDGMVLMPSGWVKRQDPEWCEKERTRLRELARKKRLDPEYRKLQAEKQRERRAKKKAEQTAQSS